jgi:hypothetical protein
MTTRRMPPRGAPPDRVSQGCAPRRTIFAALLQSLRAARAGPAGIDHATDTGRVPCCESPHLGAAFNTLPRGSRGREPRRRSCLASRCARSAGQYGRPRSTMIPICTSWGPGSLRSMLKGPSREVALWAAYARMKLIGNLLGAAFHERILNVDRSRKFDHIVMQIAKITVIGSGSAAFSLAFTTDLCATRTLWGSTVILMDISPPLPWLTLSIFESIL